MSIKHLAQTERRLTRRARKAPRIKQVTRKIVKWATIAMLTFGAGGACGRTFRQTFIAAGKITCAALADTAEITGNAAKAMGQEDLPPTGLGSMQTDHDTPEKTISIDEARALAAEYGYTIR